MSSQPSPRRTKNQMEHTVDNNTNEAWEISYEAIGGRSIVAVGSGMGALREKVQYLLLQLSPTVPSATTTRLYAVILKSGVETAVPVRAYIVEGASFADAQKVAETFGLRDGFYFPPAWADDPSKVISLQEENIEEFTMIVQRSDGRVVPPVNVKTTEGCTTAQLVAREHAAKLWGGAGVDDYKVIGVIDGAVHVLEWT